MPQAPAPDFSLPPLPPEVPPVQEPQRLVKPVKKAAPLKKTAIPTIPIEEPAAETRPQTASVPADPTLLPPATYPDIWKKVLNYFMTIRRIDVFTCLKKGTLIYCTKQRAVVSSPQQWLVAAGNNKSYQKIAAEAFEKTVGSPVMIHVVLQGGEEEADTLTLLKSSLQNLSEKPAAFPSAPPPDDGYHLIQTSQVTEEDRNAPSFKEALKILPDCDIYEKG